MPNLFLGRYPAPPIPIAKTGKASFGRSTHNFIVLTEPRVSRFHAQIEWQKSNNRFVLTDLGSANGTFINGKKIKMREPQPLNERDKIRIASTVYTVRFVDDPDTIMDEYEDLILQTSHEQTEIIGPSRIANLPQQPSFSGGLEHLCPIELFQILETGEKTGLLTIKTKAGDGSYTILKGKVLTAQFKNLLGEKAVYEILKSQRGTFEFLPELGDITHPQIELATSVLITEGCRLLDEATSKAPKATAR